MRAARVPTASKRAETRESCANGTQISTGAQVPVTATTKYR